jgi:hypothetical protein
MRRDHGALIALTAIGALTAASALGGRRGGRNERDDEAGEDQGLIIERLLARDGIHNVGLNADWSVSAWRLGDSGGFATYLLDNEDDTFSVVNRFTAELSTVDEIAARNPGWSLGEPIPFREYRDEKTGTVAPQGFREHHDGYNDMIVEIWSSDKLPGGFDAYRGGDGARLVQTVLGMFPR